jgi:phosphate uptake regulator
MKRKVVQHGPATLIISLPSTWVKKYEVSKGDELNIIEDDNSLLVSTEIKRKSIEAEIDITDLDRTSIMYVIRGFYRLGYDKIKINFKKPTTMYQRAGKEISTHVVIHTEVNRLVGYEVIQESDKSCTIKDLQDASGKDFDQVLRRIFLLLNEASKSLVEGAKTKNDIILETIENKHDTITKFASYCLRLLNKKNHPTPRKTSYYYHIIASIDRIVDIIKYAARDLRKYKTEASPEILKILEKTHDTIYNYYKFFYKYDNEKIREMNGNRYMLEKKIRSLPNGTPTIEIIIATNIFHILEMLLDLVEARTALEY